MAAVSIDNDCGDSISGSSALSLPYGASTLSVFLVFSGDTVVDVLNRMVVRVTGVLGAAGLALLAGCASDGQQQQTAAAQPKEARCTVTGSNVPKRDCRHDVEVLTPGAADSVMPVLQSKGAVPRN